MEHPDDLVADLRQVLMMAG
ncbi:MAG TPA: hypothetical protein PKE20_04070 [Promineifilum sp.]|nr:hypothetical protein [Promineifilum sp.]